jgi:hypothetical protein
VGTPSDRLAWGRSPRSPDISVVRPPALSHIGGTGRLVAVILPRSTLSPPPQQKDAFPVSEGDAWFQRNGVAPAGLDTAATLDPSPATLRDPYLTAQTVLEVGACSTWRQGALRRERPATACHGVEPSASAVQAGRERIPVDIVQLPGNVLGRRSLEPHRLGRLRDAGVEIQVRSALLQGSLVGDAESVAHIPGPGPCETVFQSAYKRANRTPFAGALGHLQALPEIDVALIGVEDTNQLNQALESAQIPLDPALFDGIESGDPRIVDPSQ